MAFFTQKRILNLIPRVSAPVTIHVSQGDVGTEVEFSLLKGDERFYAVSGMSATVHGVRNDGANFGPFTCTLNSDKVSFSVRSEMTALKGVALAEIVIVDTNGNKVGSANFGILVETSTFPLGVTYDNDVSVYESMLSYVQALQARIDAIISPSGEAPSAAEILDARLGADGVNYNTLGEAIRTQDTRMTTEITDARLGADGVNYNTLGEAIRTQATNLTDALTDFTGNTNYLAFEKNKYINTSGDTADINTPISASNYQYAVIPCASGEQFVVTTHGGGNGRAWAFIQSDGTILKVSPANADYNHKVLYAPTNATHLIVNSYDYDLIVSKKIPLVDTLKDIVYYATGYNKFIDNSGNNVNIYSETGTEGSRSLVLPCSEGDIFYISATGRASGRAYAFIQSDGTLIENSPAYQEYVNEKVVAPANSAYIVVNSYKVNTYQHELKVFKNNAYAELVENKTEYLKSSLFDATDNEFIYGSPTLNRYISLSGTAADITNSVSNIGSEFVVILCSEGDVFYISAHGTSNGRAYGFLNENGTILKVAPASTNYENGLIVAPANAIYLVVNSWKYPLKVCRNKPIKLRVNDASSDLFRLSASESVPVDASALSYSDFISNTWDTLLSEFANEVTKSTVINDSSNAYPIYKYVFTPRYYKKTVFLVAGMHGNEYEGFWGLYKFISMIYRNFYDHKHLMKLRNDIRFIIIPILNPYGMQNKQRYNSQGIDANQNYDVYWDNPNYTHTGDSPFSANESKAVKLVADEYTGQIDCFADFHTDPYDPQIGLFSEAALDSEMYETLYKLTLNYQQIMYNEMKFAKYTENIVHTVYRCNSYNYMEQIQHVPACIIEVSTGGFAPSGSSTTMKYAIEWYSNLIIYILNEVVEYNV